MCTLLRLVVVDFPSNQTDEKGTLCELKRVFVFSVDFLMLFRNIVFAIDVSTIISAHLLFMFNINKSSLFQLLLELSNVYKVHLSCGILPYFCLVH